MKIYVIKVVNIITLTIATTGSNCRTVLLVYIIGLNAYKNNYLKHLQMYETF